MADDLTSITNIEPNGPGVERTAGGMGCAIVLLCTNALIFGLFAMTFARGPYSSWGQELWYRYGSSGLFLGGAVLPGILLFGVARSRGVVISLTLWMLVALFLGLAYAFYSGGGV